MRHWCVAAAALIATPLAAQQITPGPYRVPSAAFATYVGCDSAKVVELRAFLLQRSTLPGDTNAVVLTTACDALAWLGRPNSYDFETFNGQPAQEVWHLDHDTLPPPLLQPQMPGHPWLLTPPLRHRPPRV